jgi:hypothetical protein
MGLDPVCAPCVQERPSWVMARAGLARRLAAPRLEALCARTAQPPSTRALLGSSLGPLMRAGVRGGPPTVPAAEPAHPDTSRVSTTALYYQRDRVATGVSAALGRASAARAAPGIQALAYVCEDHLFEHFLKVHIADSTGFRLPEHLKDSFPGSGGSATQAGAKIQLVWEYKQRLLEHFALMLWKLPDNK